MTVTSRTMGAGGMGGTINTHTLRTGDGRKIVVDPTQRKAEPQPEPQREEKEEHVFEKTEEIHSEPTLEPFNSTSIVATLINVRVTKGLKTTPDLKEDIWISDKIDTGSSVVVSVPENKKPIRIVHRADWEEGVQRLVRMLIVPNGPLDPKLKGLLDDLIGTDEDESKESV